MSTRTNLKIAPLIVSFALLITAPTFAGNIIYVDDDAAPSGDGKSWETAFTYLQDALATALSDDEIHVAQGVYKPDQGVGITPGNREATFQLIRGVTLKGGYAGAGTKDPNTRNIGIYKCILSGDLNGDDGPDFANNGENSYHVVCPGSETTLDGFIITAGNANGSYWMNRDGGGIRLFWSHDVKIYNCIIRGNTTSGFGGGTYLGDSDATLINCVFSGNQAGNSGGGLFGDISDGSTYATITNCTFNSNSAWNEGGGIHMLYVDRVTLTNCISWGNFDFTGMDELAQIYSDDVVVSYSCIQGWTGSLGGIGNIGDEPLFVDSDGADHVSGTEDDNFRLLPGSPCVDTGDNLFGIDPEDFKGPPVESDLDGNQRIVDDIVDMGAYEGAKQVSYFLLSTESVTVQEDGTAAFTVALAANPRRSVEVSIAYHCGDPDISVVSPSTLLFDSSNYSQPQSVTLAAAEDPDRFDSTALILITAPGFITAGVTATEGENEPYPNVLLVDARASGNNNGSSWTDAFNDLQEAFRVARGIPEVKEIRVAQGEYKPAGPSGEREVSFHLVDGVAFKGGYAGFGALNPDARDIDIYKTILSGDLNDNDAVVINTEDLLDEPTRAENSYHVVNVAHCGATTVLDGFTVTGGNAGEPGDENEDGAGIYNSPCYYCTSRAAVINCCVTGNSAAGFAGGLYDCDGPITNCIISGNLAQVGSGLLCCDGPISNCIISGNFGFGSYAWGGGLSGCNGPINNCLVVGNSAQKGGGLTFCNGHITNCTVTANSAVEVCGGLYFCGPTTNCIVWGNSDGGDIPELAQIRGGNPVVNYCCIQDWTGDLDGTGNFGTNPCFIDSNKGDYQLLPGSPCINAGDPNYVAGPSEKDLDGKPRIYGGRIDMGAFEYQPRIIYVDDNAPGANDGSSWTDAFNYLQDALAVAKSGDEIRVAQGIFKPDQGAGITPGDRIATFHLINGVTLKGGYAGLGQPDPNARDIELYETILTGDLNGNDVEVEDPAYLRLEPTRSENSYQVVIGSGTDETAVLDGFTITGGNGAAGGGMYNDNGSPTLILCTFRANSGGYDGSGGGMYNSNSSPTLTNCNFIGNAASWPGGGGMVNYTSSPTLINCSFIGNTANSTFYGGEGSGGAIKNWEKSSPTLINCVFIGNSAADFGGAIESGGNYTHTVSNPTLINCTIVGNLAGRWGGAMLQESGTLTLKNSILWNNTAPIGSMVYLRQGYQVDATVNISYSDIEGGQSGFYIEQECTLNWGVGNIDTDPCFVDLGYWNANGVWIDGDYHLLPVSPCINTGDPNYIAGPNETDLDGRPRVIGGRIDMGAYEYQCTITAEAKIIPKTINLASKGKWITSYIWLTEEYDVADIEPNSVFLDDEIQPEQLLVNEQEQVVMVRFSRSEIQSILDIGEVELTITGQLIDGTAFEGTDTITVTDKKSKEKK